MLPDVPLFHTEYEIIYFYGRFYLAEICVYWNGDSCILEMVEISAEDASNDQ